MSNPNPKPPAQPLHKRKHRATKGSPNYMLRGVESIFPKAKTRAKSEGRHISTLLRHWLTVYGEGGTLPMPGE